MYSEKLEKLIEFALADGVLTEKEKQVLFNKAQEEGIDLDEFEMVLEARLYDKQQEDISEASAKITSNKAGDIKKCPSCGAPVGSFLLECPHCGHEFRNIQVNSTLKLLLEKIKEIENKEVKISYSWIEPKHSKELRTENKRKELISDAIINFPIPNTKEDILEFLSFSMPKSRKTPVVNLANPQFMGDFLTAAWNTKSQEVIFKAKVLFKNDNAFINQLSEYERNIEREEKRYNLILIILVGGIILIILVMLIGIFFGIARKSI